MSRVVYVVDDEPNFRIIFPRMLKSFGIDEAHGYDVRVHETVKSAMDDYQGAALIVSDNTTGGGFVGLDWAEELAKTENPPPFVLVATLHQDKSYVDRAEGLKNDYRGPNGEPRFVHLTKPTEIEDLNEAAASVMG